MTSRLTKRFFKEDYLNLTKAATNKDYIKRQQRNEINDLLPGLEDELVAAETAYDDYLEKLGPTDPNEELSIENPHALEGRYSNVEPNSPTWKKLKKQHKLPENIKV